MYFIVNKWTNITSVKITPPRWSLEDLNVVDINWTEEDLRVICLINQ